MKLAAVGRFVLTSLIVGIAVYLGYQLWLRYMDSPWTRDGRVRANIVQITADVGGRVVAVPVHDNEFVHRGDVLFEVDPARYQLALANAKAHLAATRATLEMKRQQAKRRVALDPEVVSAEQNNDTQMAAQEAMAAYDQAKAELDLAKLNLQRATVRAPVNGYVTNLLLRPGDYAAVGAPKMAIVDADSFWVYGYFEETRLRHVQVGDPAQVTLLGHTKAISGRVASIAYAIADRDNPVAPDLTADVNPVFNWVRLASRIPVRIKLEKIPANVHIAAGMTCTVVIKPRHGNEAKAASIIKTPTPG
ncbi:MAG: efflux transporter periplasmic adaptor subunit [Halothiobacillus sp. 15-55-196]|jgi:p-hydroxybenzoic acid efflux pump subunit AaeA|uniref:efflux RND transporter periplasmic adaptor subunit n=1 Tax=Halothiobacillus sp. 15-55-196 TaxID=1970382 RepID=UPI000BD3EB3A|nr:HlyD family secretion protein [Halothiobacillus sp. 15-55-196]OZB36456.1 MAG: efflux transporter periplasmic adaptor subunit [Halothiobacillus sp. 15-55-196]